jgi:AcrR family transcriptional regulator
VERLPLAGTERAAARYRTVLGDPTTDRRSRRHEATRQEILVEAWALAREHGLAGVSLRDLARRVGMRAPSLYSYFASKAAIYDAMFAAGNAELLARIRALPGHAEGLTRLRLGTEVFVTFCVEDPIRYQLLFLRTIPGFEPSPESYAGALAVLQALRDALAEIGVTEPGAVDLYTAITTGLVSQQLSNEPGGDRWLRLVPVAVEMFWNHQGRNL